ncbi:proteasome accessory factor PafA2 family protein [Streptomyces lavendulae]
MLTNGARLYVDHAHPEYSSPEAPGEDLQGERAFGVRGPGRRLLGRHLRVLAADHGDQGAGGPCRGRSHPSPSRTRHLREKPKDRG